MFTLKFRKKQTNLVLSLGTTYASDVRIHLWQMVRFLSVIVHRGGSSSSIVPKYFHAFVFPLSFC